MCPAGQHMGTQEPGLPTTDIIALVHASNVAQVAGIVGLDSMPKTFNRISLCSR